MEKNKKNTIIVIVSAIVLLAAIIFAIVTIVNHNKDKANKKQEVITVEDKKILNDTKVNDLTITDQLLYYKDGFSNYNAKITNPTKSNQKINSLYVVFSIKEENMRILALKDVELKPNEKADINISIDKKIDSISDIKFVLE